MVTNRELQPSERPPQGGAPSITVDVLERVVVDGNLDQLTPAQRLDYYRAICEGLGLNPLTRPFQYLRLQGRLTLYATRDATDQLRRLHGISLTIVSRDVVNGVYVVTVRATTRDGRTEESIGAVSIDKLTGDALANALMKAETKAKRRVTLSIVGLGWLDETEIETVPGAQPVSINHETGEIIEPPAAPPARPTRPQSNELPAVPAHTQSAEAPARDRALPSTAAQQRAIHVIASKAGLTDQGLRAWLQERYGVEHTRELTKGQASEAIDALQTFKPDAPQLEMLS